MHVLRCQVQISLLTSIPIVSVVKILALFVFMQLTTYTWATFNDGPIFDEATQETIESIPYIGPLMAAGFPYLMDGTSE